MNMTLPQRKLHRLQNWDYSQPGYYFVTICTKDKRKLLSTIHGNGLETAVIPTKIGQTVLESWSNMESVYPQVKLDYYCLMPNHLHGIIIINQGGPSLSHIIRAFKSVTTRYFNTLVSENEKGTLWQSSFYDEIIRNEQMLFDIRKYIYGNPSKWLEDSLFVE